MQDTELRELQAEVARLRMELLDLRRKPLFRARQLLRSKSRGFRVSLVMLAMVVILGVVSHAAQITLPWTFQNGAVADATQVNANFSALTNESNSQDTRITNIQNGTAPITGNFQVNGNSTFGSSSGNVTTITDIMKLTGRAHPPVSCDASVRGMIYLDNDGQESLCLCKLVDQFGDFNWVSMSGGSGCI